jgi:hypothetical protein
VAVGFRGHVTGDPTFGVLESDPNYRELGRPYEALAPDLDTAVKLVTSVLDLYLDYEVFADFAGGDICFPGMNHAELYRGAATILGARNGYHSPSAEFFQTLPMPGLDRLSMSDLVKLRRNDATFAAWRDELTQIIAIARRDFVTMRDRPEEFQVEMSARLAAQREAVVRGVENAGFFGSHKGQCLDTRTEFGWNGAG